MKSLPELFSNNEKWRHEIEERHPGFFKALGEQQNPEYLWIGCADSRVPANEVVGMMPGELFVHRNVANLVNHTDLNLLSVLQFAVNVLKVKHIMVVGHYGCGGVDAALQDQQLGLIDNWLGHIRDIAYKHRAQLSVLNEQDKCARLCELNVLEQADNVKRSSIVKEALKRGQPLQVHSWIYSLRNGRLKDLSKVRK